MKRRVIVVDGANRPVADALVTVEGGDTPMPDIAFATDSKGVVTVDLPNGGWRITAHGEDGRRGTAPAGAGQQTVVVILA